MATQDAKIISASRRTDIPAFYSEWLLNRVREGWCLVPNPLNYSQLIFVSLRPENVAALVLWSKNPEPLVDHLDDLDSRGLRYYFQYTLNEYPHAFEPGVPPVEQRIRTFQTLSARIGPRRVIWRYDPIIVSNVTPPEYHIQRFRRLSSALKGYTDRVMISFIDYYQKTDHGLLQLEESGIQCDRQTSSSDTALELCRGLWEIASSKGMEIFTCAEDRDFSSTGVTSGSCIDGNLLSTLWGLRGHNKKDSAQRASCLCVSSRDIGVNDTCPHGCPYCYATRSVELAQRRYLQHNPRSPVIWGKTRELTEAEQAILSSRRLL